MLLKKMGCALVLGALMLSAGVQGADKKDYPVQPVPFTQVQFSDGFWSPRLETNRKVTIPYDFKKCEETDRLSNFDKAAAKNRGEKDPGKFIGIFFNDSDVFKIMEGAAYSLAIHEDPQLRSYLDNLIKRVAAAQEKDGYLYTSRTIDPEHPQQGSGPTRWSSEQSSHELYNVGHMYEGAVAHFMATGDRTFLDVAIRNANLIDQVFGPKGRPDAPGHQEIEIGLCRLYRATGDEKYLQLAKFFIDTRGNAKTGRKLYGEYAQDHLPVLEQKEAVGHAVRAAYLYSGIADVAALTGEKAYVEAIDRIWSDVVEKKLYLTGGIGARADGEAFGAAYELPNESAYNETCAAIANCMWNHRMFLLHGDACYLDVLERTLYNGFLSGVSIQGDKFFYPNPLASSGNYERSPWFDCSCCPSNVVRFLPSLPGYVYAQREGALYVNLFVGGEGKIELPSGKVTVRQTTRYPWDGKVALALEPAEGKAASFALMVRIPGWARNEVAPGGLYRYEDAPKGKVALKVNGQDVPVTLDKGFARIEREWKKGDQVELDLPMSVRRVLCDDKVEANRGRVALERGPIVYCVEAVDNGGSVKNLFVSEKAAFEAVDAKMDVIGELTVLKGKAARAKRDEKGNVIEEPSDMLAIPYYAWAHRAKGQMAVWLPREAKGAELPPIPTLMTTGKVTSSHVWEKDSVEAVNDGREPKKSNDGGVPRMTWWDHKGTSEWVECRFEKPAKVAGTSIYWFDDTGAGQCRVPKAWKVLYRDGETWKPVKVKGDYAVSKDKFNEVEFEPVQTQALRVEVQLQPEVSGGVLEWKAKEAK